MMQRKHEVISMERFFNHKGNKNNWSEMPIEQSKGETVWLNRLQSKIRRFKVFLSTWTVIFSVWLPDIRSKKSFTSGRLYFLYFVCRAWDVTRISVTLLSKHCNGQDVIRLVYPKRLKINGSDVYWWSSHWILFI